MVAALKEALAFHEKGKPDRCIKVIVHFPVVRYFNAPLYYSVLSGFVLQNLDIHAFRRKDPIAAD